MSKHITNEDSVVLLQEQATWREQRAKNTPHAQGPWREAGGAGQSAEREGPRDCANHLRWTTDLNPVQQSK